MISVDALSIITKSRNLNHSDLARMAGVSRQAVSLWFKSGTGRVDLRASHLLTLCEKLNIAPKDLSTPLPESSKETEAELLWDRLYPDLESFAVAVVQEEPRALARLAEAYGLYGAEKAAGKCAIKKFKEYERYLPPGRREALRTVWEHHD